MKTLLPFFCVVLLFATTLQAQDVATKPAVGSAMTAAASQFLGSLSSDELAKATMKFDDPARLDWHNIPKENRKGLQIREMSTAQQKLCHELLRTALSPVGYEKAVRIMSLEANLLEGEKNSKGTPFRDPQRYFLTIFGKPESIGSWGWSFEGHHFSLNFVIKDGVVIADTPSFWGANPATVRIFVPGGPEEGARTLANEEQLAFDLVNSLNDSQRSKAIIADKAPDEYRAAGQPEPPHAKAEGLTIAEMTDAQAKTLWSLLETYCNHLAAPLATARLKEIRGPGAEQIAFAWAGATQPGVGHYYRIQGSTFLLELINVQADPAGNKANHVHSVWRSLPSDFGLTAK